MISTYPVTSSDPIVMRDQINSALRMLDEAVSALDPAYKKQVVSAVSVTNSTPSFGGMIADNSITTTMLIDGVVNDLKLANNAVVEAKIAANAVSSTKIVAGAIQTNHMTAGSINADRLIANSVTAAQIAALTITAAQIAAGTITATQIAANTITAAKIFAGTITATEIADATITGAKLVNATITGGKIANTTITAANITAGTITATEIANSTITGGNIAGTTITAANIVNSTITGAKIAADTISVTNLAAITAWTKQLTISTGGYINSGQTAWDTGTGFWLEHNAGTPRFSIGNSTGNKLTWNGTVLNVVADTVSLGKLSIYNNTTIQSNATSGLILNQTGTWGIQPIAFGGSYVVGQAEVGNFYAEARSNYFNALKPFGRGQFNAYGIGFSIATTFAGLATATERMGFGMDPSGVGAITFNGVIREKIKSTAIEIIDRLDLWSSTNPIIDIQNTLRFTTSDGAYNLMSVDGGSVLLQSPFRIKGNAASGVPSALVILHMVAGSATVSGTPTQWDHTVSVANLGFTVAPNWGLVQALDESGYSVSYRDDLSTSTSAVFRFKRRTGAAFTNGEVIWFKGVVAKIA